MPGSPSYISKDDIPTQIASESNSQQMEFREVEKAITESTETPTSLKSRYNNIPSDETTDRLVKVKTDEAVEVYKYYPIFEKLPIKNEELDIEEEILELGETRYKESPYNEIDRLVTVKTEEDVDESKYDPSLEILTIKTELDLKEENFELDENRYMNITYDETDKSVEVKTDEVVDAFKDDPNIEYLTIIIQKDDMNLEEENLEQCEKSISPAVNCKEMQETPRLTYEYHETFQKNTVKVRGFNYRRNYKKENSVRGRQNELKHFKKFEMFKCHQCEHEAYQKQDLKIHMQRHMNPKDINMFKCDKCEYQTIHKNNFLLHSRPRHCRNSRKRRLKCSQ